MTQHGWRYRTLLVLLTLGLLIPQAIFIFQAVVLPVFLYRVGAFLYPSIPGLTATNMSYSELEHVPLWQGKIVRVTPNQELMRSRKASGWQTVRDYVLEFADLIAGERIGDITPLKQGYYRPIVLNDRLFLIGSPDFRNTATESYEFVEGQLKPFEFIWSDYNPMVLIEEKPFRISSPPSVPKPVVTTVEAGQWTTPQEIVIPSFAKPNPAERFTGNISESGPVQCLNDGATIHTFVRSDGKLYYRRGLTLQSSVEPKEIKTYGGDSASPEDPGSDSAWQQVLDKSKEAFSSDFSSVAIINGKPVALIVHGVASHHPVGHLYQSDGTEWIEKTVVRFPFGSNRFRLVSPGKGLPPYVIAATSTGTGFAYRWEGNDLHEVNGQGPALTWKFVKRGLLYHLSRYAQIIGLGLIPCLGIALMSSLFTRSEYSFGLRTVKLASFGRRALARFVDFTLIAAFIAAIAWFKLRDVNWLELAESWNLKVSHPDFHKLSQTVTAAIIVIALGMGLLVLVQAVWGVTLGKWICGIRTVRATLRPCGFAKSLIREILLVIDSVYLLWWVPGSLSIGLTNHRQRLGDLVGDTIVVTARSLNAEHSNAAARGLDGPAGASTSRRPAGIATSVVSTLLALALLNPRCEHGSETPLSSFCRPRSRRPYWDHPAARATVTEVDRSEFVNQRTVMASDAGFCQ